MAWLFQVVGSPGELLLLGSILLTLRRLTAVVRQQETRIVELETALGIKPSPHRA